MKLYKYSSLFIVTHLMYACSTGYEVVMPYKNLGGYSGERIFPIKVNESVFAFRVWINNSTSIDRVITVSKDSNAIYTGDLIEIGKKMSGKKSINYFHQAQIKPLSGFENLKKRLDSLNLITLKSQTCCIAVPYDSPSSTYVVEIKTNQLYNLFRFDTNYPLANEKQDVYAKIEKIVFDEFALHKYFKFEQKNN